LESPAGRKVIVSLHHFTDLSQKSEVMNWSKGYPKDQQVSSGVVQDQEIRDLIRNSMRMRQNDKNQKIEETFVKAV